MSRVVARRSRSLAGVESAASPAHLGPAGGSDYARWLEELVRRFGAGSCGLERRWRPYLAFALRRTSSRPNRRLTALRQSPWILTRSSGRPRWGFCFFGIGLRFYVNPVVRVIHNGEEPAEIGP